MKYEYEDGARRWFRWPSRRGDPRGHVPPRGWEAYPDQLDYHPLTGRRLPDPPQWWMLEVRNSSSPN